MATLIDSLVVALGLDASPFNSGKAKVDKSLKELGGTAGDTGKKLKKAGTDGAEGFKEAAATLGKFLAMLGGTVAVKQFISDQIEANAALDRFAKNLDTSAQSVSAWGNAAEIAGGSMAGLQGTMDMLSRSQTEMQLTGQSSLVPYFSALGVAMADVNGKGRQSDEILLDLADRLSTLDRPTANNMGRMMGIDQGTLNLLLKGRQAVEGMIKQQKEFGAVSKQQAEEASRMRESLVRSRQTFEAFARSMLSNAAPALEKLFVAFERVGAWMRDNQTFVQTFLSVLGVALAAVGVATIPINLTAVAILALAAAIATLWDDYQTWKAGGESLIPWDKWEPQIKKAIAGVKSLARTLMDTGYRMAAFLDMTYQFYSGNKKQAKAAYNAMVNGMPDLSKDSSTASAPSTPQAGPLADLVSKGEGGYNSVNLGKAGGYKAGTRDLGSMSLFDVMLAQKNKEFNAVGRYQMIPSTLKDAVKALKLDPGAKFTPELQDRIFKDYLISQKRPEIGDYISGKSDNLQAAQIAAAKEWASLKDPRTGHGVYDQPGVNSARIGAGDVAGALMAARGIPGAAGAAQGAGAPSVAAAGAPMVAGSRSVETHIGEVKVYTQATDARGIAQDMAQSVDYAFVAQANSGNF